MGQVLFELLCGGALFLNLLRINREGLAVVKRPLRALCIATRRNPAVGCDNKLYGLQGCRCGSALRYDFHGKKLEPFVLMKHDINQAPCKLFTQRYLAAGADFLEPIAVLINFMPSCGMKFKVSSLAGQISRCRGDSAFQQYFQYRLHAARVDGVIGCG